MRRAVAGIACGLVLAWMVSGPVAVVLGAASRGGSDGVRLGAEPVAPGEDADEIELAFDAKGVLHLVAHLRTPGRNNHLVHRSQSPGGPWSNAVELAPEFAIAGGNLELARHPDGSVCLFFDGWRDARDGATVGLYLTCLRDGRWEPAQQIGASAGVTATFDGAFTADGHALGVHARPTRMIGFGERDLWQGDVDAGWPRLAIDGQGVLHAAWGAFANPFAIFTSRSTDGGLTWTAPESLTAGRRAGVPFEFRSDANGDIHLLAPATPSLYRRWTGGAWSPTVTLDTTVGPQRLAVGSDGRAVVAWGAEDGVTVIRERADGTWTEPVILEPLPARPLRVAIAIDDAGAVAVVWTDATGIAGSTPAAEGFAESVPSPFDITLDPVIVAQSAALAAGVVLLIPFPAQLFNNTVEANYARISAAGARLRRRIGRG